MGTKDLLIEALNRVEKEDLEGALEALEEAAGTQPDNRGIQRILEETQQALRQSSQEPAPVERASHHPGSNITRVGAQPAPTGFFRFPDLYNVDFFSDRDALYETINNSLKFYREHLNRDYDALSGQAALVFKLWVACVLVGF
ncbi:MAG: hypothetical protein GY856_06105, partial [bacterium]|nr:hypothetical protein [bacterium]